MAYTTAEAVSGIIEVDDEHDVGPFIDTANSLVEEICVPAGYGAARLEIIERWLAAHFYAILGKMPSSETVGPVSENYQYKVHLNLANTMYGQQAMLLDTAGGLAKLNKQTEQGGLRTATAYWLGKEAE